MDPNFISNPIANQCKLIAQVHTTLAAHYEALATHFANNIPAMSAPATQVEAPKAEAKEKKPRAAKTVDAVVDPPKAETPPPADMAALEALLQAL